MPTERYCSVLVVHKAEILDASWCTVAATSVLFYAQLRIHEHWFLDRQSEIILDICVSFDDYLKELYGFRNQPDGETLHFR